MSLPRVDAAPGIPIGLVPPFVGHSFPAHVVVGTTAAPCSAGVECTVVDRPITVPLVCLIGKCKGTGRLDIGRATGSRSIELGRVDILDDLGNVLAVPGL